MFLIILLIITLYANGEQNITRSETDSFSHGGKCLDCFKFSGYCKDPQLYQCCTACTCYHQKTYFKNEKNVPMCIDSPAHDVEKCIYHFQNHENRGQSILMFDVRKGSSVAQIGIMKIPTNKRTSCNLLGEGSVYWDGQKWMNLFTDGRQASDFYIANQKLRKRIGFVYHGNSSIIYEGLLVKLAISCKGLATSCLMFKFGGSRVYGEDYPTVDPTVILLSSSGAPIIPDKKVDDNDGAPIAIIASVIAVCLLLIIISIVIIILWRRRKRKSKDANGAHFKRDKNQQSRMKLLHKVDDDVIYQTPDHKENENNIDDSEFDNPGYLIPIDSKKASKDQQTKNDDIVYQDVDVVRKKKDPNYDYPEVANLKKPKREPTHEYARVSVIDDIDDEEKNSLKPPNEYKSLELNSTTNDYQKLNAEGLKASGNTSPGYQELNANSKPIESPLTPSKHEYFELEDKNDKDTLGVIDTDSEKPIDSPLTPSKHEYFDLEDQRGDESSNQ